MGLNVLPVCHPRVLPFIYHVGRTLALRWPVDLSGCFISCPMLRITGCAVIRLAGGIKESKKQQIRSCL